MIPDYKLKTSLKLNALGLVVFLMLFSINSVFAISIKEKTENNSLAAAEPEISISHFSNNLRTKHMKNISLMNSYLNMFAQIDLQQTADGLQEIKSKIKAFFNEIGENINEVNTSFKDNYDFCINKLKKFSTDCNESIEDMKESINFNTKYSNSLKGLSLDYDKVINNFYDSNIFSTVSSVCGGQKDITDKNDVVMLYTSIAQHLDQHFKIFKSDEMNKILLEVGSDDAENNLDKFLDFVVAKYKENPSESDYVAKRRNLAQILFNKVSSYMNNSIERKSSLLRQNQKLFEKMKANDVKVQKYIEEMKNQRKNNSELSYSLHKENQITINKINQCTNFKSLNSKCEESGNLYKIILGSYKKQSASLQNLFNLLGKN